MTFTASAGTTYVIAVDGKNGSEGGFELWLKAQSENDEFASAQALDSGLPGFAAGSNRPCDQAVGRARPRGQRRRPLGLVLVDAVE